MRAVIALLGCILFCLPGTATAAGYWIKDAKTGCEIWTDEKPTDNDIATWTGDCIDGKAAGEGKLTWTENGKLIGTYDGLMKAGKLEGLGLLELVSEGGAEKIESIFHNGLIGKGVIYEDAAGNSYEGEIKEGQPHGTGYQKIGEEEYVGEFENGARQGIGLLITPTLAFLGEFKNNAASGSGVLEDDVGGRYHGIVKNGKPHGAGTYITKEGGVYQGYFQDGKANGKFLVKANSEATVQVETWKDGEKVE